MAGEAFDDLADVYEALIDWPKRLANETPFYRWCFNAVAARRIADVACGTGHHAAMFHSWGLRVEAADISPRMIELARRKFGQPEGLSWTVRGFETPIDPAEPLDVALCVGNSLALAADREAVARAIAAMFAAVRPGGAVLTHALNLWRLPDGPCVWQKRRRVALPGGEGLVVKGVHRAGDRGYVELLVLHLTKDESMRSESPRFLGLEAADLERTARRCGAADVAFFGGFQQEPYDRAESVDLIMLARKGA